MQKSYLLEDKARRKAYEVPLCEEIWVGFQKEICGSNDGTEPVVDIEDEGW